MARVNPSAFARPSTAGAGSLGSLVQQCDQRLRDMASKVSGLQEEAARERARHAAEVHLLVQKNNRLFQRASECTRSSGDSELAARELHVELMRLKKRLAEASNLITLLKERLETQVWQDLATAPFVQEETPTPARLPEPAPAPAARRQASPDFSQPVKPGKTFQRVRSLRKSMALRPLSPLTEHSDEGGETPPSTRETKARTQRLILTSPESPANGEREPSPLPTTPRLPKSLGQRAQAPAESRRTSPPAGAKVSPVAGTLRRTSPAAQSPSSGGSAEPGASTPPHTSPAAWSPSSGGSGRGTPLRISPVARSPSTGGSTESIKSTMSSSVGPTPTASRPRRASASRSFVEPSLRSKLRKGDANTFGNAQEACGGATPRSSRAREGEINSIALELEAAASTLLRDRTERHRSKSSVSQTPLTPSSSSTFHVHESPPAAAEEAAPPSQAAKPKAFSARKKSAGLRPSEAASSPSASGTPLGLREVDRNTMGQAGLGPACQTGKIDGYRYALHFD